MHSAHLGFERVQICNPGNHQSCRIWPRHFTVLLWPPSVTAESASVWISWPSPKSHKLQDKTFIVEILSLFWNLRSSCWSHPIFFESRLVQFLPIDPMVENCGDVLFLLIRCEHKRSNYRGSRLGSPASCFMFFSNKIPYLLRYEPVDTSAMLLG